MRDGQRAQLVVVRVRKGLAGGDDDALARVDAERVEVLHVAHRDAVVVPVAHDFVFDLFPAPQALFDQHLRGEGKGLLHQGVELLLVVAEAAAEASQRVGGTYDDGVAYLACGAAGIAGIVHCLAADGLHAYLVESLHEAFAVFGVDDGLHGCTQHVHAVAFERPSDTAPRRS